MQIQNTAKITNVTDFGFKNNVNKNEKVDIKFNQMMEEGNIEGVEQEVTESDERINTMIEDIDELKKKLEEQLTLKNLEEYKNYVRKFVEHYSQNEIEVKEQSVQNTRTYANKKYTVIESINEKVDSMTDDLLKTNRGHLELLSKMGEINGLIINLLI